MTDDFNQSLDAVYDYIVRYKLQCDGLSPTVRDIRAAINLSSTSIANHILAVLEDQGRIKRIPNKAAGIMVTGGHWSMEHANN